MITSDAEYYMNHTYYKKGKYYALYNTKNGWRESASITNNDLETNGVELHRYLDKPTTHNQSRSASERDWLYYLLYEASHVTNCIRQRYANWLICCYCYASRWRREKDSLRLLYNISSLISYKSIGYRTYYVPILV